MDRPILSQEITHDWEELAFEVITGFAEWRLQHPKATFSEIEAAFDERSDRMRARMLADAAMASSRTDWKEVAVEERPTCPECGTTLVARSLQTRSLQSQGSAEIVLERSQGTCPECGTSLFPPG